MTSRTSLDPSAAASITVWDAIRRFPRLDIMDIVRTGLTSISAPGQAGFAIGGQTLRLEPVIEDDHLFYIFKDHCR